MTMFLCFCVCVIIPVLIVNKDLWVVLNTLSENTFYYIILEPCYGSSFVPFMLHCKDEIFTTSLVAPLDRIWYRVTMYTCR